MNIATLPKIELHLHLDCSLSYGVVSRLAPGTSYEEYRRTFVAPPKCHDLAAFIAHASRGIELMQTREALRLVVLDLLEQVQADRVLYAEIRFAPLLHTAGGLRPEEVVQAVVDGLEEGITRTGVHAGLILCTLRHFTAAQSMETVRLAEAFAGSGVAGFDIAADEAGFPVDAHIAAFQYALAKGIPCTAHAGEVCGADSVWETLRHFRPRRIGHGVRSVEDPALIDFLIRENIHLEVCPTSNIQTNVFARMEDHVADRLFRAGVSMSINTDGRAIADVTLGAEYQTLQQVFGWGKDHFLTCNLEAIAHAFTTDALKATLREQVLAGYAAAAG